MLLKAKLIKFLAKIEQKIITYFFLQGGIFLFHFGQKNVTIIVEQKK